MSKGVEKILIVRLSAIGDVINTLPSLTALRRHFPLARISWLVEDRAAAILDGHPFLDKIFVFERKRWQKEIFHSSTICEFFGFIHSIKRERFEIALDFQGNLKSAMLLYLIGPAFVIGYAKKDSKEFSYLFSDRRVSLPEQITHRIEKFLYLLSPLGVECEAPYPIIQTTSEEKRLVEGIIGTKQKKLVVIHPGASGTGAYKKWDMTRYSQLADRLKTEKQAHIIITCGPGEEKIGRTVQKNAQRRLTLFSPPTIKVLAQLLKCADLFIGADTGPLYIASAVKTPVVALFGPTDPRVYGPYFGDREIVWKRRPCCPCKDNTCTSMNLIEVGEVFEKACLLLDGRIASDD